MTKEKDYKRVLLNERELFQLYNIVSYYFNKNRVTMKKKIKMKGKDFLAIHDLIGFLAREQETKEK